MISLREKMSASVLSAFFSSSGDVGAAARFVLSSLNFEEAAAQSAAQSAL